MDMRICLLCIIINLFCPSVVAKTFSLNEAIAEEERNKATVKSAKLPDTLPKVERLSSPRYSPAYRPTRERTITRGPLRSLTSLLSPLKNRRIFPEVNTLLKPRTLKRPSNNFIPKYQSSTKVVESSNNEEINKNYLPLFKSLSIILDNVLNPGSGETYAPRNQYKRNPTRKFESDDVVCSCALKTTTEPNLSASYEETASSATIVSSEIKTEIISPPTATTKTHSPTNNNIGNLGRHKNISILPPGDTNSIGRNTDGIYERRGASHIGDDKRFITGNKRNHEYDTGIRNIQSHTKNSKENTYSDTRHSASSYELRGTRPDGSSAGDSDGKGNELNEHVHPPIDDIEGKLFGHEGKTDLPNREVETKSPILLSKSSTRLRKLEPQKTEILQTKDKKDFAAIEHYITSAKRVSNSNSKTTTDNKRSGRTNETVVFNKKDPHNKVLMIFDGYSVARDVNGENKMSEKALEIHT